MSPRREPRQVSRPGGDGTRFPGYDVLQQARHWDAVTAGTVLARIGRSPDLRFFTVAEEACAGALFDHLLAQWGDEKVPVLQWVDARLAENQTDGWRYEDMPEDGEAWRRSLAALDEDAAHHHAGRTFAALERNDQARRIQAVQDLGAAPWYGMPAAHVWSLWTRYACTAFYSHPWAWNEIGFGGPAYPRGYLRLGTGAREPWEVADHNPVNPVTHPAGTHAERRPGGPGDEAERSAS